MGWLFNNNKSHKVATSDSAPLIFLFTSFIILIILISYCDKKLNAQAAVIEPWYDSEVSQSTDDYIQTHNLTDSEVIQLTILDYANRTLHISILRTSNHDNTHYYEITFDGIAELYTNKDTVIPKYVNDIAYNLWVYWKQYGFENEEIYVMAVSDVEHELVLYMSLNGEKDYSIYDIQPEYKEDTMF